VPRFGISLDPKKQQQLWDARQVDELSIAEITKKYNVSAKTVARYAGPEVKDKVRKSEFEVRQSEGMKVHSDEDIAKYFDIDIKDAPKKRGSYLSAIHREANPGVGKFGAAVNDLKEEIRRIFPDDHPQILKGANGGMASLEEILEHPLIKKKFATLIKRANRQGLKLDKRSNRNRRGTNKFKRTEKGSDALRSFKNNIVKIFPKSNVKFENELKVFRDKGLSFDSKEVQDLIKKRAGANFLSLKARSDVWSWDTVDGLPKGAVVPGTKKKVANLFFADDTDQKAIREMYRRLVEKKVKEFYKTGRIFSVDHVDHIFPSGNPRIVNGQLLGGAFDADGKFLGVGVSNRQNLRKLAASVNMAEQHFISPERIKLLERLENVNAVSVEETQKGLENRTNKQAINDTLKRLNQLGEFQAGRVKTSPRLRMGGTAFSIPLMIGAAALSEKSWGAGLEAAKSPWLYADAFTGIDTKRTVENPSRLFSPQTVIYQDIIEPTAGLIAQGLRSRDPTEDEYAEAASMGSPQGLLGEGHPGFQDRLRKWY
jgi:hypothetical protein